jgi:tRNA uridine 5-carbamoylmethylation protein Kti12
MENNAMQVLDSKPERLKKQLKLIEGKFSKREALNIINNVLDVKINFHKLQRLSRTESNINDACTFDTSRITELINDKANIKAFLTSLEVNGCDIKISSTIHISVEN